ncbi:MAG: hypothetical protein WCI43_00345 [Candidatus Firestonebacteria bacterium]
MRKITILFLLAAAGQSLLAGGEASDPMPHLKRGPGARAAAMGAAFSPLADDASCVYWNPAGMMQMGVFRTAVSFMYSKLEQDRTYGFAGVYERSDETNTAIGFYWTGYYNNGAEGRDEDGNFTGMLGSAGNTAAVALAGGIADTLKAGLSLKAHFLKTADLQGNGFSLDAGFIFKPLGPRLRLGAVIKDLNTGIQWGSGRKDVIPFSVRAGAAYYFIPERLVLVLEPEMTENCPLKIHIGAEYILDGCLSLRAGLDGLKLTSGFGLKAGNYSFDYSFMLDNASLGDEHRFSISAYY